MGVPPGSALSRMGMPSSRRRAPSIRHWVDLPLPSGPSKVRKRPLVVDIMQHCFQVFPGLALGILIVQTQQIRWMISHHYRNVAPFMPFPAQARDPFFGAEQGLRRSTAEGAYGPGVYGFQL